MHADFPAPGKPVSSRIMVNDRLARSYHPQMAWHASFDNTRTEREVSQSRDHGSVAKAIVEVMRDIHCSIHNVATQIASQMCIRCLPL